MIESSIESYVENLSSRALEVAKEHGGDGDDWSATSFREQAFTEIIAETLTDIGHVPDVQLCFFEQRVGRGIAKINGWSIDEEDQHLHLVTTLFRGLERVTSVPNSEIHQAVTRSKRVIEAAKLGHSRFLEPASEQYDMLDQIEQDFASLTRATVHVVVDGVVGDISVESDASDEIEINISVWDLRRLDRIESSDLSYDPIEIDLVKRFGSGLPVLQPVGHDADYQTLLAVVPGVYLNDLYHEFGSRLLELNVRSFLQARGKVNQGIRDTLREEPDRFLAYNNGLSATAEWVEFDKGGNTVSKIRGLQIVNGGQTVASIHRAGQNDEDLGNVFVQAKITVIRPEHIDSLVPLISRYANTQNKVNEADFSANHPYHVKLQQLSRDTWVPGEKSRWFFERARGQYETEKAREGSTLARRRRYTAANPVSQKFDKVKLAKYQVAWWEMPHVVSLGGQKCFVQFMRLLSTQHQADWEPDTNHYKDLIARAIIFKRAERASRVHKFPAYRANAIAYTVGLVAYRTAGRVNMQDIWEQQATSENLGNLIHDWMPYVYDEIVESSNGRNVTEWCKKEECWRHIQTMDLPIPPELEAELDEGQPLPNVGKGRNGGGDTLSAVDRENIARVMRIVPQEWLHFVKWGADTNQLTQFQTDLSATLAGYATRSWTRVPSVKQARQAVKVIDIADERRGRFTELDD